MKKLLLTALCAFYSLSYGQVIDIELFAGGFTAPTDMAHAGDSRMFLVEQGGTIRIINSDGSVNTTPFLNISSLLSSGGERGLLGLAFHPDYTTNGYFFVNYTNTSGDTVIARYSVSGTNPDMADAASAMILLTVDQPYSNHNGGCLRFGPDGYLYISMGDGGSGGDPNNYAQNNDVLLGKMLRLDVDNGSPYGIPAGNAFANTEGADEIWSNGLRNAWKFSFNGNDMWIADVGQNAIEEINRVDASLPGYYNFGWRCYEGSEVYNSNGCSVVEMFTAPVAEYTHQASGGCSITGGYVYNGSTYPALQGHYIFADYCNNKIGMLDENDVITWSDAFAGNFFSTFGEDINGGLYIAGSASGNVYRVIDSSTNSTESFNSKQFTIYPNPADEIVSIASVNGVVLQSAIVYDISGKQLMNQDINTENASINIANLPSGLYVLQLTSHSGDVYNHKLSVK